MKAVPNLRGLSIDASQLDDAGARALEGLPGLRWLRVRDDPNSMKPGVELERLSGLTWLERLMLATMVDSEAIAELKQALPDTAVIGSP